MPTLQKLISWDVINLDMHLIMFDIDGTLTLSNDLDNAAFLQALNEVFGFSEVSDDWASYTHVTDACIFREIYQHQIGRNPPPDEVARFQKRLLKGLRQGIDGGGIQPVPGAGEILSLLLASPDHQVAYASGAWIASATLKLQSAKLPIHKIPAAFSDDAESREEIMAIALQRAEKQYGQTFSNIVYVGDGVWDIRAAKKSGYAFIGIGTDDRAERLRREGANHVFTNYDDRASFFAALASTR